MISAEQRKRKAIEKIQSLIQEWQGLTSRQKSAFLARDVLGLDLAHNSTPEAYPAVIVTKGGRDSLCPDFVHDPAGFWHVLRYMKKHMGSDLSYTYLLYLIARRPHPDNWSLDYTRDYSAADVQSMTFASSEQRVMAAWVLYKLNEFAKGGAK